MRWLPICPGFPYSSIFVLCSFFCLIGCRLQSVHGGQPTTNLTGSYVGKWQQREAISELKTLNGTIELHLVATPSNHSKDIHAVRGDLHLGRPLTPQRYHLRGEYNTLTGELLVLATPLAMQKYLHDPRHLNFSRVLPSYYQATQRLGLLLQPHNLSLAPRQAEVLANRTGFIPDVLDPHWDSLRTEVRGMKCVGYLRLHVHVDHREGDYTVRTEEDGVFEHKLAFGGMTSQLCNISLDFNATTRAAEVVAWRAQVYALAIAAATVVQLASLIRQMEYTTTQASISTVSLFSLGQLAYLDFFVGLTHLGFGVLFEDAFRAFAIVSFLKFCLCALFEVKYLHAVWKAQRPSQAQESVRCLCLNIYLAVFIGVYVLWKLITVLGPLTLFVMFSFWLPQIVSNVLRNSARPLQLQYILVQTVSHALPPLYFLGCPANIMEVQTHVHLLGKWLAYHFAVAGLLVVQYYFGARVFVPACLLPKRYNYHRPFSPRQDLEAGQADGEHGEDCAICRHEVDLAEPEQYMVTPCDHIFHASCLSEWMYYKMECPICRGRLPDS
eukprot:EG_transcript_7066